MARSSRMGKFFKWVIAIVVIIAVVYSLGWFFVARTVKARIFSLLEGSSKQDITVSCQDLSYKGYPLNFGFVCDQMHLRDRATNTVFDTPKLTAGAAVYAPWTVMADIEGPANLTRDNGSLVRSEWENLSTKMIYGDKAPELLSGELSNLTTRFSAHAGQQGVLTVEDGKALVRQEDGNLDVAVSVTNAVLRPRNDAEAMDPISFDLVATVEKGISLLDGPLRADKLRGKSGVLNNVTLVVGDNNSHVSVAGPFSFDNQGYLTGNFNLELAGVDLIAQAIKIGVPESANVVDTMATLVRNFSAGQKVFKLSVGVDRGRARIGFIPIGKIPPI